VLPWVNKMKYLGVTCSAPEILKFPRKNLDVLFIALLMPYLAASVELLQKKLCCNCFVVNVFQFCYMALRLVH